SRSTRLICAISFSATCSDVSGSAVAAMWPFLVPPGGLSTPTSTQYDSPRQRAHAEGRGRDGVAVGHRRGIHHVVVNGIWTERFQLRLEGAYPLALAAP